MAGTEGQRSTALAWGAEMRLDLSKLRALPGRPTGCRFGPLEPEPLEPLVGLYQAAYQGSLEAEVFPEMLSSRRACTDSLRQHLAGPRFDRLRSLTAWSGEALAGFVIAHDHGQGSAYVVNVAVLPRFRRHGVGRAMLVEVLLRYRAAAYRRVALNVLTGNVAALGLYESLGFRDVRWELNLAPRP